MNYNIVPTLKFEKEIKGLFKKSPSLKEEYSLLIAQLKDNPTAGTSVGDDCYKYVFL